MKTISMLSFIIVLIFILSSVAIAASLSCNDCVVGDCSCTTNCPGGVGSLRVYDVGSCVGVPYVEYPLSGNSVSWSPDDSITYYGEIYCDENNELSNCVSIQVNSGGSQTTTTTTTIYYPPRPRTTRPPRDTTTTSTTTTTTTTTSTTTTTTTTTTSTTTTTLKRTTTTTENPFCNENGVCDVEDGENHETCPYDCNSGLSDKYCDGKEDGKCDPDCSGSKEDPDCPDFKCGDGACDFSMGEDEENCPEDCANLVRCNDGRCDYLEGENYLVCPEDCTSGSRDGYCDKVADGICDEDCTKKKDDPDCGSGFIGLLLSVLPFIILLVLLILVLLFLLSRRKRDSNKKINKDKITDWVKVKLRQGEDPDILRKGLEEEGYDPTIVDSAEEEIW